MIMKKNILYLVAFISMVFVACNPLKDEINNIKPVAAEKTLTISTTTLYGTADAANIGISAMLNSTYPQLADGSKANVTYSFKTNTIKPADSVYANIQYTVTANDYTTGAPVVGNFSTNATTGVITIFNTYSVAQAASFLEWKYPQATTPAYKLVLLTYQFFQSNATPSAGVTVTEAFLLMPNGWQKIYLVSPAQYAALGRGINNGFTSADVANLPSYFNTMLKSDPNIISPKVGDVRYVTYKYMQSGTLMHQKVYALSYDATGNWVPSLTLAFLKKDGKWIPDPTIYYTLVRNDYNTIGASNAGTANGRANLAQFGSFDVTGGANNWTEAQIADGLIVVLNAKYPNAPVDPTIPYKVTYALFRGATPTDSKSFVKTPTGFVLAPAN
ncbi:hypothetical protein SAMN04488524_0493 [Pedobacter africanus]|uniref:DUF1735 domain-containing protein n=2 Tax=Pedobacter africanus TaxID=151894 RepID=A0A1W1ZAF5_9SPHI|nr:hypothetical protein SAMN04488524_0493 [Pedobacter africanus]